MSYSEPTRAVPDHDQVAPGEKPVGGIAPENDQALTLTLEHRMLLRIRDTLYEGSWDDFETDLRARAEGRPHVFDTVPLSADMQATVASHLRMIAAMRRWEETTGRTLGSASP